LTSATLVALRLPQPAHLVVPALPAEVIANTAGKYREALQRLTA